MCSGSALLLIQILPVIRKREKERERKGDNTNRDNTHGQRDKTHEAQINVVVAVSLQFTCHTDFIVANY